MDKIAILRANIDQIDEKIIKLIAKRSEIVKNIGKVKNEKNLSIKDIKREKEKIALLNKSAEKYKIDHKPLEAIWRVLFKISYKIEQKSKK
jgi:chorismate mutase